ncbi:CDP-alcohol phosphatidyltransferase family protein [bacterium]|nr:CDP-alcohol phosphatidyltransferase family protein [bacterium]
MSLHELRVEYRKSLKALEVEEWADLLIYRPLGFLIALPLRKTPVSPNLVTLFSVIVGVAGAVGISLGTVQGIFWGGIFYAFSNVLDCSDGQLARMTGKFSRYGRIYDGVADYVVGLVTFLAIGIGWQPETYPTWFWWMLVFLGGIVSTTYQGLHLNHVRESYLHAINASHTAGNTVKAKKEKKSRKRKFFLIPFFTLYLLYLKTEKGVRRNVKVPHEVADPNKRPRFLHTTLILWTFNGKGSHVTVLTLFLLLAKPEIYLWFTLIPWNLYIMIVWYLHNRVIKSSSNNGVSNHESTHTSGR